jgi:hypothetical protein
MATTMENIVETLISSAAKAEVHDEPYRYWIVDGCLPNDVAAFFDNLSLSSDEGAADGRRELRNDARVYIDARNKVRFPIAASLAEALMDRRVIGTFEKTFGQILESSYLRIEFAEDRNGFWLEPHTDLGVKLFTMLLYTSADPSHADLGTDIYDNDKKHLGRAPFRPNTSMIFIPSNITYHGFERRKIEGVRKSIIINYVTNEWRAREQLAFPERPV